MKPHRTGRRSSSPGRHLPHFPPALSPLVIFSAGKRPLIITPSFIWTLPSNSASPNLSVSSSRTALLCFSIQHLVFSNGGAATCEQLEECSASSARTPSPRTAHPPTPPSVHWIEAPDPTWYDCLAVWVLSVVWSHEVISAVRNASIATSLIKNLQRRR